jgi:hypothetical protein
MTSITPVPASAEGPSDERVRCRQCDFRWYGEIAAHGLSVLGSCPRCGGD